MLENASDGDFSDDYDEMVEGEEDDGDSDGDDDDDGDEELIFVEDEEDFADISLIMTFGKEPEKKKRRL